MKYTQAEERNFKLIEDYKTLRFAGEAPDLQLYLETCSEEDAQFIRDQIEAWEWFERMRGTWKLLDSRPSIDKQLSQLHARISAQQTLAKIRKERQRVGFVTISFAAYVRGLAKRAGVSLTPVLEWLGIANLSRPNQGAASAFAQLAQEMGLSLGETLVQIRIGFAEQLGIAQIPGHFRPRTGGSQPDKLEVCDTALQELESEYNIEGLRELRSIEDEIRAVYGANENAPETYSKET